MSLVRSERGTASVEMLVMLPMLILLFAGSIYLHRRAFAHQQMRARARGCALEYALHGCPDEANLTLCEGVDVSRVGDVDAGQAGQDSARARSILDEVSEWWLIGDLLQGLFGTGSRAVAKTEVPGFRDQERLSIAGDMYLICNTLSEPWTDRIKAVTCGVADKVHLGSSLKWLKVCP